MSVLLPPVEAGPVATRARRSLTIPIAAIQSWAMTEPSTPYSRKPGNRLGMRNSPSAASTVIVMPPITNPVQPSQHGYQSSTIEQQEWNTDHQRPSPRERDRE